jgi:UTP--glucose-1-phosphate uridylyltransferase
MLPVVDKPRSSTSSRRRSPPGLDDVLMITGRNKRPLEDHFDRAYELEQTLAAKGDDEKLRAVHEATELATVHYVRQGDPRGLGHAVCAPRSTSVDEPFAVLLGDDLIDARDPLLPTMIEVQQRFGGNVVALLEVPREQISSYGCAAVESTDDDDIVRIVDLVEKPSVDEAPSNLAIIGRYVLAPEIFDVLARTEPGRGGEIQLTDAMRTMTTEGGPMHGVVFRGRRYDTGDRLDYLKAVVRLACDREDLGRTCGPGCTSSWPRTG